MDTKVLSQKLMDKCHVKSWGFNILTPIALLIHLSWRLTAILPQKKTTVKRQYLRINAEELGKLLEKEKVYKKLNRIHQDDDGFVHTDRCDSLLLSSLLASRKDYAIDIFSARDYDGYWHRRSTQHPECYPNHSKSSISRDMLMGLLVYATFKERIGKDVLSTIQKQNYVMGIGDPSRIMMMPSLERSFSKLIGRKNLIANSYQPFNSSLKGYAVKLELLHIMCLGKIDGGISEDALKCLKNYSDSTKDNILSLLLSALYSGNYSYLLNAINLLQNQKLFPDNRLPTSNDRSVDWYWDVQNPNDVLPDNDEEKEHPGADFLFYMWVLKYVLNIME